MAGEYTRRDFLKLLLLGAAAAGAASALEDIDYVQVDGPSRSAVKLTPVPSSRVLAPFEGLTVVQLSKRYPWQEVPEQYVVQVVDTVLKQGIADVVIVADV